MGPDSGYCPLRSQASSEATDLNSAYKTIYLGPCLEQKGRICSLKQETETRLSPSPDKVAGISALCYTLDSHPVPALAFSLKNPLLQPAPVGFPLSVIQCPLKIHSPQWEPSVPCMWCAMTGTQNRSHTAGGLLSSNACPLGDSTVASKKDGLRLGAHAVSRRPSYLTGAHVQAEHAQWLT